MIDESTESGSALEYEPRFQSPERMRKPVLLVAAVASVLLALLIYLMVKGPSSQTVAGRIVDAAISRVPAGRVSAEQVIFFSAEVERAQEVYPASEKARSAFGLFQQRVNRQLADDIKAGQLNVAEPVIRAARRYWVSDSATEELNRLDEELLEARLLEQVVSDVSFAVESIEMTRMDAPFSNRQVNAVRDALLRLREGFDVDPENQSLKELQSSIVKRLVDKTVQATESGDVSGAKAILMALETVLPEEFVDPDLQRIRSRVDKLTLEADIATLLGRADGYLASDRLMYPPGQNAVELLKQALSMDPGNVRALEVLSRVGDRYAQMASDALARREIEEARSMISRLSSVAPSHRALNDLYSSVAKAQSAARQNASAGASKMSSSSSKKVPLSATDSEGRLWLEVRDQCDEGQIRRYINSYPAGRYIEEAWRLRSQCLSSRTR